MTVHPFAPVRQLMLNVGLAIGNTGQSNTLAQVVQAAERAGLTIDALAVHTSTTEPTVVARVTTNDTPDRVCWLVNQMAVALAQDCIAIHWLGQGYPAGSLVGPAADLWGSFDPTFFITLDGSPLVDSQPVAA